MDSTARNGLAAIVINLGVAALAVGQQAVPAEPGVQPQTAQQLIAPDGQPAAAQPPVGQQAIAQQPVAPQPPPGFQLNALEQTQLDTVLNAWQQNNAGINTFRCTFDRLEYDVVFGPKKKNGEDAPLYQNVGELSYSRPDKGSFQITETNKWQETPAPPGQPANAEKTGAYVKQDTVGDHWVCDGKSVYQYRPDLKQLVEHPIPPQLQGQAIVDGPLPFLIGADAAKLKAKYWLKIDQEHSNAKLIAIVAQPKFQAQAANFTEVDIMLDRQALLPQYMQVWMPNRSHHVYIFHLESAKRNAFTALLQSLFERPSVPFGWKRVVENTPLEQAAEPKQPPR